jgi:hypothetical protein
MEALIDMLPPEKATEVRASFEYAFYRGHGHTLGGTEPYRLPLIRKIREVALRD